MRGELRPLTRLALPVVGAQVGSMLMGVVDTIMVGRISVEALAASAMANSWIWTALLIGQGLVQGIDPLVAQSHGASRGDHAGLALQRGIVMALVASLPIAGLWLLTGDALLLLGQHPDLVGEAHRYTVVQVGSIPFFLIFVALRQYLQGREIVRPAMWVVLFANLFNAAANYVLIFGKLGFPELGLLGAGIASALTRGLILLGLVAMVVGFRLHEGAWLPWSRESFSPAALWRITTLGLPVAIQVGLEVWAFSGSTLLAGLISPASQAAHTVVLNIAALAFMVPLGISQAAVTRVGNLLGAKRPEQAQQAAWASFAMGGGVMCLSAVTFILFRHRLGAIYTEDTEVIAIAALILPIAATFQIFDGLQVVGAGILRGMGRTRPAAWFNFFAYWVIGLPLGSWLALRNGWGLVGLWWGLALGLGIVAVSMLAFVRTRGPAHAAMDLA